MSLRVRNMLYTLVLLSAFALFVLVAHAAPANAQAVTWPAPVLTGGAMPVTWNGIVHPTSLDWIGLYAPEGTDHAYIDYIFINGCSHFANFAWQRASGTCGFVVPSTIPPGIYELRLYTNNTYEMLSKSPTFEISDGGWR